MAVVVATVLSASGFSGLTIALRWLWLALVIEELHDVLPSRFHYSRERGQRYVTLSVVVSVGIAGLASLQTLAGWLTLGWADDVLKGALVALGLVALLIHGALVLHILSAVETLEEGRSRDASIGLVILNVLIFPLFAVSTHHRVRRYLRRENVIS